MREKERIGGRKEEIIINQSINKSVVYAYFYAIVRKF